MYQKLFCLAILAILGSTLVAADLINITGSTTVFPITEKCAQIFEDENPGVEIELASTGSSVGISSIIDGTTDVGNASRAAKKIEIDKARSKGIDLHGTVVALDGVAVVVHPNNKVNTLSLQQLKDIYTGKITSWKEVGGADKPILVISRDPSSGTFEVFNHIVLKDEELTLTAILVQGNQSVADAVAMTESAIGYIGIGFLQSHLKALSIEKVEPSSQTISSGEYALSRKLYMYTNGKPRGHIGDFVRFVLSERGQAIVKDTGFLPVN